MRVGCGQIRVCFPFVHLFGMVIARAAGRVARRRGDGLRGVGKDWRMMGAPTLSADAGEAKAGKRYNNVDVKGIEEAKKIPKIRYFEI